jgi:hypothetical protein
MAIAVIGGVITSTFLTLLVVPVVFAFFEQLTPRSLRVKKEEPERLESHAPPAPAAAARVAAAAKPEPVEAHGK